MVLPCPEKVCRETPSAERKAEQDSLVTEVRYPYDVIRYEDPWAAAGRL
jgi:hypothetical protein